MDYRTRKLPEDAAPNLVGCPIGQLEPFTPLLAPAYVYLRLNAKFVMLKTALDLFEPDELERLQGFKTLYFPPEPPVARQHQRAGATIRELLTKPADGLAPAPYETAAAVLKFIAPLWDAQLKVDPFHVVAFTHRLCDPLGNTDLRRSRDQDVESYERALIGSSWAVFLALHLGYTEFKFLNGMRREVFAQVMDGQTKLRGEAGELIRAAEKLLGADPHIYPGTPFPGADFALDQTRAAQKLASRLENVRRLHHA